VPIEPCAPCAPCTDHRGWAGASGGGRAGAEPGAIGSQRAAVHAHAGGASPGAGDRARHVCLRKAPDRRWMRVRMRVQVRACAADAQTTLSLRRDGMDGMAVGFAVSENALKSAKLSSSGPHFSRCLAPAGRDAGRISALQCGSGEAVCLCSPPDGRFHSSARISARSGGCGSWRLFRSFP
jgi:hypothetical protein